MRDALTFSGVIPANLLPFTPDYAIDEAASIMASATFGHPRQLLYAVIGGKIR